MKKSNLHRNKKITLNAFFLVCAMGLTSCLNSDRCPEYESIAAYGKKYAKAEGWQLASVGSFGKKGYSGPSFDIDYRGRDIYEIEEARDLIIHNLLIFLEQHHNNKELISTVDLKNGRFSYRNIQLGISLYHKNYERLDNTICMISSDENRIRYWRYDGAKGKLILVHREPLNEALRLSPECKDKSIIYEDPDYPPFEVAEKEPIVHIIYVD